MDYGQILKNSIAVTKKNKWLWIYGTLLGGLGSLGSGGGGGNDSETQVPDIKLDGIGKETAAVLGTFTSSIADWVSSVNSETWILLGLGIFAAIVIGVIIGIVIQAWAKSALITGVQMALNSEVVSLENTSPKGKEKTKELIKLWFVALGMALLFLFALGILGVVIAFAFAISKNAGMVAVFVIALPGTVVALAGFILLGMTGIYAERLVVLNGQAPYPAWKTGFNIARKNFGTTAFMGIVSGITGALFAFIATVGSLIILAIPGVIVALPSIMNKEIPGPFALVFLGLLTLIFIAVASAISGMVNVFKFSNWNQVFTEVVRSGSDPEHTV